jgi:hypothetical protein
MAQPQTAFFSDFTVMRLLGTGLTEDAYFHLIKRDANRILVRQPKAPDPFSETLF